MRSVPILVLHSTIITANKTTWNHAFSCPRAWECRLFKILLNAFVNHEIQWIMRVDGTSQGNEKREKTGQGRSELGDGERVYWTGLGKKKTKDRYWENTKRSQRTRRALSQRKSKQGVAWQLLDSSKCGEIRMPARPFDIIISDVYWVLRMSGSVPNTLLGWFATTLWDKSYKQPHFRKE